MTTTYPWLKLWIGTADDPKLRAAARLAGCHKAIAVNAWIAALEYAGEHQDRGSVKGLLPEVLAEICDTTREIAARLFQAFRELGMLLGERIAKWIKRQKEKLPRPRTAHAERQARYRHKLASQASQASREASREASHVTVEEEEGVAFQRKTPESTLDSESLAAREVEGKSEGDSFGRSAPFERPTTNSKIGVPVPLTASEGVGRCDAPEGEHQVGNAETGTNESHQPSHTNVVQLTDGPTLKARKKEMRQHKVFNFVLANYDGDEQLRRMNGMCNLDLEHDDQWWFDKCDRERIRADWDDVRDGTRQR